MADLMKFLFIFFFINLLKSVNSALLCDTGFCRTFTFDVGCAAPASHCSINNETHTGISLLSPTECNCCEYCLPFFGKQEPCSLGGPGTGTTIGRCGHGLYCTPEEDGNYCRRMDTPCHRAQDEYDERHARGETGALEQRPICDTKGKYATFDCIPTQTCFCQSEEGERLFGEVEYLGASTMQNMHCRCSRFHEKIMKSISPTVPLPVVGPRCLSDGNFSPVQCMDRTCYCVNRITGLIQGDEKIDLDIDPISKLSCYDPDLDLFPEIEEEPPYNFTSPCLEGMQARIDFIEQSREDGFNVDYFTSVPGCLPDGTYGRTAINQNGSKICIDEHERQIGEYEAEANSLEYETMDCKCALTTRLMTSSTERPVCCKNGNFRGIQCRRGQCRCVDSDGRQIGREATDVTSLACYTQQWRDC